MNTVLINKFLNNFKDNKESYLYFTKIDDLDNSDINGKAEIIAEYTTYEYMKTTLGLIHCIDDSNNKAHLLVLTEKGKKVLDKGGWDKYKKYLNRNRIYKNSKTELKYWIGIFLPIFGLYLGLTHFSSEKLEALINERLKQQSRQQQETLISQTDSLKVYNQKLFHRIEEKLDSLKN
jgi:hypothetical protein